MINHPRGSIHLSSFQEISSFKAGQEIHFVSWNTILLPCYRVTLLPFYQEPTHCSYRNLFGNIHYTIIRFTVILFFHLRLFHPSDGFSFVLTCTLLNAFLNFLIAVTCSPITTSVLVSLMIFCGETNS